MKNIKSYLELSVKPTVKHVKTELDNFHVNERIR